MFLFSPTLYAPGFELTGIAGEAAIQGFGVLFLMWNVPYVFALINPSRYRTSYLQAVIMQTTGFLGEALIFLNIPPTYRLLQSSILRFIVFDGAGLILLIIGYKIISQQNDLT